MRKAAVIVAMLLGAVLLFFVHIGYLGDGDRFTLVAATPRPVGAHEHRIAVLFSGDMGFTVGMGPSIAKRLAADGIPVIGVNSLGAFRVRRTPAEATALVAEAIRRALALDPSARIALVGQSFGADMLQVGLAGLAPDLRARIGFVALVVPGATVEYRASPGEIFTFLMHEEDALPTARTLDWVPALCVHGAVEENSLCPLLSQPNMKVLTLPGGHPLHHDDAALHAALLPALDAAMNITEVSASPHAPVGRPLPKPSS